MRATVRLPDALMRQARREARRRNETLTSLIEKGLRHELASETSRRRQRVEIPVFKGGSGTLPGVDLRDSAALWDVLDGVN